MLLHGEADNDVPFEQSVLMVDTLKDAGVEFEWITNPTWGHVFDAVGFGDLLVAEAFEAVRVFLDSHLKLQ